MAKWAINEEFLQQVEALQMLIKNNVAGLFGGNHQSKTFGSSCEFSDYRDYIPGVYKDVENIKHFDDDKFIVDYVRVFDRK